MRERATDRRCKAVTRSRDAAGGCLAKQLGGAGGHRRILARFSPACLACCNGRQQQLDCLSTAVAPRCVPFRTARGLRSPLAFLLSAASQCDYRGHQCLGTWPKYGQARYKHLYKNGVFQSVVAVGLRQTTRCGCVPRAFAGHFLVSVCRARWTADNASSFKCDR